MNNQNVSIQRNQSVAGNSSIGRGFSPTSRRAAFGRGLLLALLLGMAGWSALGRDDGLAMTLAPDQAASMTVHGHQADIIDDILDILGGVLGGGSGSGGSGGSGAGGGGAGGGSGGGTP